MIVVGSSGSGKTHLLNLWLQHSGGKSLTLEKFAAQDIGALSDTTILAIDDAERVAGDDALEEKLFHLFNRLREAKGWLLLTAAKPPAQWDIKLADLRSRLLAAPVATIGVPDDELLSMLLLKQFHDRQIDVGAGVIAYILPRITRSADAVRQLVATLDHAALAEGRGITVAMARRLLEDGETPPSSSL